MAKPRTRYVCQACGSVSTRWQGKCPDCGEWNTLVEEVVIAPSKERRRTSGTSAKPVSIASVGVEEEHRLETGLREFDRVLGGGLVPGSVVLLAGDPGIGKSTLMLQACAHYLKREQASCLYVTGEESLRQIKLRADRLGVEGRRLLVYAETNINDILAHLERLQPAIVVVDSIQTVYQPELSSTPGSISQVRESTAHVIQFAKSSNIPVIVVGHVTKDGSIAGPRVLEHMVDVVLQFEGDHNHAFRIVRALKNRFGSTNEIGLFEMHSEGLREVSNPSRFFLSQRSADISGSCVTATIGGSRSLIIEIQALLTPSNFGIPQRTVNGIDPRRLQLILAVLERQSRLRFGQSDVFVNVVGGVRVDEPAVDLAVALSVVSSLKDKPVGADTLVVGELGLAGEVRHISQLGKRLHEAAKLGFSRAVIPGHNERERIPDSIDVQAVQTLNEALAALSLQ